MDYDALTTDQRAQVLEQRILNAESEHFNQTLTLGAAEATGAQDAVEQAKQVVANIEGQLKFLKAERSKLTKAVAPEKG